MAACCACLVLASAALAETNRLAILIDRAQSAHLHTHPRWLALGHYERGVLGLRTRAGGSFLLSADGDRSPRLELAATLRAFAETDRRLPPDERARCRFPARFHWLDEVLDLGAMLSQADVAAECPAYAAWRAALDVAGVSLIFPEGFMESPASMFGHTLLRLDTGSEVGEHDLLGHAVDFTASIGDDGAAIYLLKGIAGLYPGYFNVTPYHTQLRRYTDWENRDIWEYRLNLEQDELELLLEHLWELKDVDFPYLFFTENCSHQLIALLEVAHPGLQRQGGVPPTVIPADTVRSLTAVPGLVGQPDYRPSPARVLEHQLNSLDRDERRQVRSIAAGELPPDAPELALLDPERHRAVLEAAYKTLRYQFLAGRVDDRNSRSLSRRILLARSQLADQRAEQGANPPPSEAGSEPARSEPAAPGAPPHLGHGSAMLSIEGGIDDGNGYLDLLFRPAYHDLMDADAGYTRDMQIGFLSGRVRYYPGSKRVRLQDLALVEALSLSPWSRVFKPLAWRFETALRTRRLERDGALRERPVWRTAGGLGLAFEPTPWLLGYGLADLTLDVSPELDPAVSFGPGAMLGAYLRPSGDRFRTHLHARVTYYAAGEKDTLLRAGIEERVAIGRNLAIRFEASFNRARGQNWFAGGGSLRWYF